MRPSHRIALVIFIPWLATAARADDDPASTDDPLGPVPAVVARVNGIDLSAADLGRKIQQLIPRVTFHATIPRGRARELRAEALEALILDELKWQQAAREGLVANDEEVRAEVDRAVALLPAAEKAQWLGRERVLIERHGAAVRRRLTLTAIEAREVPERIEVPEARIDEELAAHPELAALPPQVRIRHILVKVDPAAGQEQYETRNLRAIELRERIEAGTPFAEVAREASDDVFRERGGETDWLTAEEIIYGPVARAAFSQEPGVLGPVLESLHGFHLVEVIERRDGRTLRAEEARARVRARLAESMREEKRRAWHAALREGAEIERLYDPLSSGEEPAPEPPSEAEDGN